MSLAQRNPLTEAFLLVVQYFLKDKKYFYSYLIKLYGNEILRIIFNRGKMLFKKKQFAKYIINFEVIL